MSMFGNSRYLSKENVGAGSILTIASASKENIAKENEPEKEKWVLWFHESKKGFVLGPTTANQIIHIFGLTEEVQIVDGTIFNQQITLWNDPTVPYAGKFIGGIRVRQPSTNDVVYSEGSDRHEPPPFSPANPGFRPDPRQTPPRGSFQQAQHGQHVQPARPVQAPYPQPQQSQQPQPAARPAVPRPPMGAPRPPMGAPAMPAHNPPAQPSFDGAGTGDDKPPFGEPTGGRF